MGLLLAMGGVAAVALGGVIGLLRHKGGRAPKGGRAGSVLVLVGAVWLALLAGGYLAAEGPVAALWPDEAAAWIAGSAVALKDLSPRLAAEPLGLGLAMDGVSAVLLLAFNLAAVLAAWSAWAESRHLVAPWPSPEQPPPPDALPPPTTDATPDVTTNAATDVATDAIADTILVPAADSASSPGASTPGEAPRPASVLPWAILAGNLLLLAADGLTLLLAWGGWLLLSLRADSSFRCGAERSAAGSVPGHSGAPFMERLLPGGRAVLAWLGLAGCLAWMLPVLTGALPGEGPWLAFHTLRDAELLSDSARWMPASLGLTLLLGLLPPLTKPARASVSGDGAGGAVDGSGAVQAMLRGGRLVLAVYLPARFFFDLTDGPIGNGLLTGNLLWTGGAVLLVLGMGWSLLPLPAMIARGRLGTAEAALLTLAVGAGQMALGLAVSFRADGLLDLATIALSAALLGTLVGAPLLAGLTLRLWGGQAKASVLGVAFGMVLLGSAAGGWLLLQMLLRAPLAGHDLLSVLAVGAMGILAGTLAVLVVAALRGGAGAAAQAAGTAAAAAAATATASRCALPRPAGLLLGIGVAGVALVPGGMGGPIEAIAARMTQADMLPSEARPTALGHPVWFGPGSSSGGLAVARLSPALDSFYAAPAYGAAGGAGLALIWLVLRGEGRGRRQRSLPVPAPSQGATPPPASAAGSDDAPPQALWTMFEGSASQAPWQARLPHGSRRAETKATPASPRPPSLNAERIAGVLALAVALLALGLGFWPVHTV